MIYLDNAATTEMYPQVVDAMMPYMREAYGNAGTIYSFGRNSAKAIAKAREQVAALIGASPEQIIFTSGGSEANNMVFYGMKDFLCTVGKTDVAISSVEHDSVYRGAQNILGDGFNIQKIGVNSDTIIDLMKLSDSTDKEKLGLMSVMYVNNETGGVNNINEIGNFCLENCILFHTDCVQAAGCHPINVKDMQCDFLSISSHKLHGPKGMGALFVKDLKHMVGFKPMIYGGKSQEFGFRGGTENVAAIVGFGQACEIAKDSLADNRATVTVLKRVFYEKLISELKERNLQDIVSVNGCPVGNPGRILNLRFKNVDGETLVLMLDSRGICISAGSACRSRESEPSRVLKEIGLTDDEARDSVRVSFSELNTTAEVVEAAEIFAKCISVLHYDG